MSDDIKPVAWRLRNTSFRRPRYEYFQTEAEARQRQADFNRSVDDGSLVELTALVELDKVQAELDRLDKAERERDALSAEAANARQLATAVCNALGVAIMHDAPNAIDLLRAERDEHARWRADLADKLHDAESRIFAAWAALRHAGIQSEETVAEAIALLHAENERLREDAERYRWLRGDACSDHSVRWTQWEVRCWVAPFWSDDLRREGLDRSIDAAMAAEGGKG